MHTHMAQKKVVAIHDISCYGRCSLTVALPILSAAGINTPIIPTAVLSTFVGPFPNFTYRDMTEDIIPVIEHWNDMGFEFDAIYTGFLGSKDQVDVVRKAIRMIKDPETKVYVDPVMGDDGELYSTFGPDFPPEMRKLCGDADIIIPNMTEIVHMLGEPFKKGPYSEEYILGLLKKSEPIGAKKIVLTGVYFEDDELGTATYDCSTHEVQYLMKERIPGSFHGSGDIFGSGLVSSLVNGWPLDEAVDIAEDLTISSIKRSVENNDNTDHGLNFEEGLSAFGAKVCKVRDHRNVSNMEDVKNISQMAKVIWNEAYVDMISEGQTEYMLEKYLSPKSIMEQISEGAIYEFVTECGKNVGFISYKKEKGRLMLSKFYIMKGHRHTGIATNSMNHIIRIARKMGLHSIYLTVNRENVEAISAYEHWGFASIKDVDTDIGNGFFMKDHIMELDIKDRDSKV